MEKEAALVDQMINTKIVFNGPFEFGYETEIVKSDLGEYDLLMRTEYSLISPGTELAIFTGAHVGLSDPNNKFAKYPFSAGYTNVGQIVALGSKVNNYAVGDKVYTASKHAAYNVIPANSDFVTLIKLPDGFVAERAPFAKLAEFCMTAVVQSRIQIGDTVVVLGAGLIGNLAAQLYSIMGANVISVDMIEKRLEIAKQVGIENVVLVNDSNLHEQVLELTHGKKPDIVVEATGSPNLVVPALNLVRPLGQVIALGSTRGKVDINVYEHIHRKGVHFKGAYSALAHLDGFPSSLTLNKYLFKLIAMGALKIDPLITHKLSFEQAREGYDMLLNQQDRALGVLLEW